MIKIIQDKNFKKGDKVSFTYKGKVRYAVVLRVNQKTVSVEGDFGTGKSGKGRVSPYFLSKVSTDTKVIKKIVEKPIYKRSGCITTKDLEMLLEETKKQLLPLIKNVFSEHEMLLFDNVSIQWGKKRTYRLCGWYKPIANLIQITRSFKDIPTYVIKSTIWHELLHIHFKGHNSIFRMYERLYPDYTEAKKMKEKILQYIRSIS